MKIRRPYTSLASLFDRPLFGCQWNIPVSLLAAMLLLVTQVPSLASTNHSTTARSSASSSSPTSLQASGRGGDMGRMWEREGQRQRTPTSSSTPRSQIDSTTAAEDRWQSSGDGPPLSGPVISPDDEPGDDGDEGSGEPIEGSGAPPPHAVLRPQQYPAATTTSSSQPTTRPSGYDHEDEDEEEEDEDDDYDDSNNDDAEHDDEDGLHPSLTTQASFPSSYVREQMPAHHGPVIVNNGREEEMSGHGSVVEDATTTRRPFYALTTSKSPPLLQITQPPYVHEGDAQSVVEMLKPGVLAAISGGSVIALLLTILLVMFVVYRLRKKDEGSYALEEPRHPPSYSYAYQKAPTREFYA